MTPARNVEIKARVADPGALRARVAAAATARPVIIGQRDTFFAEMTFPKQVCTVPNSF